MSSPEIKQTRAAWQVLAQVLDKHGYAEEFSRFIQGAFSGQLVRSWKRRPESEDYRDTGRISPLERIDNIIDFVTLREGSPKSAQPIAHHVASRCGGVFFPLPDQAACKDSEALQHVSKVMKETGEVVEEFRKDWLENTPGEITKKEYASLATEIDQAVAVLLGLRRWAGKKVGE